MIKLETKECPKCNSINVSLYQNICETNSNGFGLRIQCNVCKFVAPKSKWQWNSAKKAIEIWNKYKRKID